MKFLKFLVIRLINVLSGKYLQEVFWFVFGKIEKEEKAYITIHKRPFRPAGVVDSNNDMPDLGVLIQGPILSKDDFTIETIKLYKKQFINSPIVVAVWEDEEASKINEIEQLGVVVARCEKPLHSGPFNINFQIQGTRCGINKVKKLGCKYVLKTRSDQRIYNGGALKYLYNLQETFPIVESKLSKRIVVSSFTTLKYRPFSVSDMLVFGEIEDMINYWGLPFDDRTNNDINYETIKEFTDCRISEVYIASEFMKTMGKDVELTLEEYWESLKEYFVIADHQALNVQWPKYKQEEEHRYRFYHAKHSYELLGFADWLSIYQGNWRSDVSNEMLANSKEGDYLKG